MTNAQGGQKPGQREQSETVPSDASKEVVVFKATQDDFEKFILSILGRPQTISKIFRGAFEVDRDQIANFYHLIEQRIEQQNVYRLVSCTVSVVYSDKSQIVFNSMQSFLGHHEIKPLIPLEVEFNCIYLIKFPDKDSFERQEINVNFLTSSLPHGALLEIDDGEIMEKLSQYANTGFVQFEVKHTARSFGWDIENLLSGHISSIVTQGSRTRTWLKKNSGKVGLAAGGTIFLLAVLSSFNLYEKYNALRLKDLEPFRRIDQVERFFTLDDVIRFLFIIHEYGTTSISQLFSWALGIGLVVSMVLAIFVSIKLDGLALPGFLLFNEQSKKYMEKIKRKQRGIFKGVVGASLGAVALNIIASILFTAYLEKLIK